jgi:glycosyltransferase involved in cell wall biosynthesis
MKRVVFVIRAAYLPGTITGANVSVHALCGRLKTHGIEPLVVCGADNGPLPPNAPPLGYTVLRLAEPLAAMLEVMERLAPDAVVVYGTQAAAHALRLTAARPRRLHFYFTTTFYGYPAPSEPAPQLRYAVNSPFLADFARAYLGFPVALVPPLFEPEAYRCDRFGERGGDEILFVNPVAAKGARLVAEIARRLPHRRFLIVPSWPDQQALPHVDFALPNVEWHDVTNDMRTVYARTKLLLMPTIMEEGWGRTVSEAQLSGIPAIVSDRGGLPETVGAGGRVLSLAEPAERWCDAIEALMGNGAAYAAASAAALQHAARPDLAPAAVMQRFLAFLAS